MWKPSKWNVQIVNRSYQHIHSELYNIDGTFSHYLTVIYAQNQLAKRFVLWDHIKTQEGNINEPWMLIEDYNNVLKIND